MNEESLQFRQIQKHFGQRLVLSVNELTLSHGECVLLTGSNGSGKTTLLKVLSGLLKPEQGEICLANNWQSWQLSKKTLLKRSIYLHQNVYLFHSSVYENVAYGLKLNGTPTNKQSSIIDASLQWAELDSLAEQPASTLSGGEKQRLALCRARVLEPEYLFLDEPASNLDGSARKKTWQLLETLREDGTGIIISSHHHQEFQDLCNRQLQMLKGDVVSQ